MRAPFVPMEKPVMRFVLGFDVYKNWPFGDIASPLCPDVLRESGKPASGARVPVVESNEYARISAGVELSPYTNLPCGCTINLAEFAPAANGEPVTGVRAAVVLFTLKTEMFEDEMFETSRNFLAGSTASESGEEPPVATGDPVPRCRAPDVASSR